MMKWIITKNNRPVKTGNIPVLAADDFRNEILSECAGGKRPVAFFSRRSAALKNPPVMYAVLADDEKSRLLITSSHVDKSLNYRSLTPEISSLHMFERELYEDSGIEPLGHPFLKPVRNKDNYQFYSMAGHDLHEVGVGPVHAGIIEPGHFRFSCWGERVYNLEISLGYQRRNIEKMIEDSPGKFRIHLAESIAGDSVISHSIAFANAIEALGGVKTTRRAQSIRSIAMELERSAVHTGDLGAISGDIAYNLGSAVFGAIRTTLINTSLELCGSRFGRGLIRPGGVMFDISPGLADNIKNNLLSSERKIEDMCELFFSSSSVLSRLEQTGTVGRNDALRLGMVGPAARASGAAIDIRTDHPSGIYRYFPHHKITLSSGDVFARAYIRYIEIKQSINSILEQLDAMPEEPVMTGINEKLYADSMVVSMTEGWRGEITHCVITDSDGLVKHYKIKDPSFNNWPGLELALRNNGISDFPLCNKSFNLSYCGFDL